MRDRRRSISLPTLVMLCWLGAILPTPVSAGEHVRVILDTSKSMRKTDPAGLARLSTVLLYDLARPDLTLDDSFKVLTFHPTQHWPRPEDPPPTEIGRQVLPRRGQRDAFARDIAGLAYDAEWTYFYPGLLAALDDLEQIPGGDSEIRTAVVLTDGLPESPIRSEELKRIRSELQPRLKQSKIWLYILAFGHEADTHRDFFKQLVQTPQGDTLGKVFVDPKGDRLLDHMIDLFGHAFGYTQDAPRSATRAMSIDLEGGTTPAQAAVVVYTPNTTPPSLSLQAPAGAPRAPTSPSGVERASDRRSSYSLQWVLSPYPGDHTLTTDAGRGLVAVLRPTRLRLEVRPRPGGQALRTMARSPFPLEVWVRPPGGAQGDPGEVGLVFEPHGPKVGLDPITGAGKYAWDGGPGAPPSGPSRLVTEGRVYEIEPSFDRDPGPEEPFYAGYLEVEARRGAAVVGSLIGAAAHRVEVFPRLRIVPSPGLADAAPGKRRGVPRALGPGEKGCAQFTLELDTGRLPHPQQPVYPMRAQLEAGIRLEGPLHGATLTLDGMPLEVQGAVGGSGPPREWTKGRPLTSERLLAEHEICVHLDRPQQKTEATLELPLILTLLESPYDDFQVVKPFVFKVWVARPGALERWRSLFLLGVLGLLVLLALWYLRDRPDLPSDLRIALGRAGGETVPRAPDRGPLWVRLLGLVEELPLRAVGEDRVLAHLRPQRDDLFSLKPMRGVRATPVHQESMPGPSEYRREVAIQAGTTWRLSTDEGEHHLRVEYDP